jgi:hypothetical protein
VVGLELRRAALVAPVVQDVCRKQKGEWEMTLNEKIREIAVKTWQIEAHYLSVNEIEQAIYAGIRAFAAQPPTEAMRIAGGQYVWHMNAGANDVYRAMMQQALKELSDAH